MSEKQESNITEEVIEEEQACKVCGLEEQPLIKGQTPKKPRKSRKISVKTAAKEKRDNWIACCVCDSWIHTGCAGLTKKEKSKLGGKAFFKCMICCFKVAKAFIIGGAFDTNESNNKKEESKNPETSCFDNPEIITNSALHTDSNETSDNITYESVIAFIDNCLAEENIQKEPKVEVVKFSGEREVTPPRKTEKREKEEKETLEKPSKKEATEPNKTEETERSEEKVISEPSEETQSSEIQVKKEECKILIDKEEESTVRSKIIVIDDIENPNQYRNSQNILKEFNQYCPKIKVSAAFALARGGITIYLNSSKDRESVLNLLPEKAFGNGTKRPLSPVKSVNLFMKGVDTSVNIEDIYEKLAKITDEILHIKRLTNYTTGRPRQTIKVT